jgi:hypothetical protein
LAADNARFATPPAANAEALALAAGKAHRKANVGLMEKVQIEAERRLVSARTTKGTDATKAKEEVEAAEKSLAEARKKVSDARDAVEKPSAEYPPVQPVYPATSTGRRLALARWIASEKNPRTARVAVNHVWLRHFGQPLVSTVFDCGVAGKPLRTSSCSTGWPSTWRRVGT